MSRGRIDPPKLDDRTWREIVDQVLKLAPQYAGDAWTDRGPSDLGVILIELFAFLVEGLAFRLDQVPERTFVEFLNLLGTTRLPPNPARVMLTYTSSGSAAVDVPAGHQVGTAQTETKTAILFETDAPVRVVPSNLKRAYSLKTGDSSVASATSKLVATPLSGLDASAAPGQILTFFLGFDQAITEPFGLRVSGVRVADTAASRVVWSASKTTTWGDKLAIQDGSVGFLKPGKVVVPVPDSWAKVPLKTVQPVEASSVTDELFWLRVVIDPGPLSAGDPKALRQKLDFVLLNAAPAVAALSVPVTAKEEVGRSDGSPFQTFQLAHAPLYDAPDAAPFGHLHVEVEEPGPGGTTLVAPWQAIDDFPPGPSQVFRVDPVSGTIVFGDYESQSRPFGAGRIPPRDSVIRAWYRFVASGSEGNVAPNTITVQRQPLINGVTVTNPGPAAEGSDEEPIDDAKRRAPESLKNRDRAVSIEDVEILAASSTDVQKVRALPPKLDATGKPESFGNLARAPGTVHVIVVPKDSSGASAPRPSLALVQQVRSFLNDRRVIGAVFDVSGPLYLPVKASITVFLWPTQVGGARSDADPAAIRAEIQRRVQAFLNPLTGGSEGLGWEVGEMLFTANLFAALQSSVPPVQGFIKALSVAADTTDPEFHGGTRPGDVELPKLDGTSGVSVAEFELICPIGDPSKHLVTFEPAGSGLGGPAPAGIIPPEDQPAEDESARAPKAGWATLAPPDSTPMEPGT